MITVRLAQPSDQTVWDNYVKSQPDAWPYHLFAWKNSVEQAYKYKAYYLLAEENQKVVGVIPLIHLCFPHFVNELTALPYCDVGNFLCDNKNIFNELLSKVIELGEKLKVGVIHIRGQLPDPDYIYTPLIAGETNKVRMLLELPTTSEALMASFKSKLRSQIRKAEKNDLIFRWTNEEALDGYYSVFSENMRDLGSPVHSKQLFKAILGNYGENAQLGIVESGGKPIGGCIILTIGDKVSIPWASTLRNFNRLAPNMLLYWNVLKYSCDNGFKVFDFGRSSRNEGTYKFKVQWGAKPIKLDWFSIFVKGARPQKQIEQASKRQYMENVWRKIPVPVANFIGPMIRKYISL